MLQQKLLSEEQYEMLSLRIMLNFLEQKKQALEKYGQSTTETEQAIVEQKIKIDKKKVDKLDTPAIKTTNIDQDALNALVSLGIARQTAVQAIEKVNKHQPGLGLEEKIKSALKQI